MTSEEQMAANRANAQRSTGPRSLQGKAAASRNATKHGAYASRLFPIGAGVFAEDPDKLREWEEAMVAALNPQDAFDEALAGQMALALWRMHRVSQWEMAIIDHTALLSGRGVGAGPLREVEGDSVLAELIAQIVAADLDGTQVADIDEGEWEDIARFTVEHMAPGVIVIGLWTEEITPQSDEQWEKAARTIWEDRYPDPLDLQEWAHLAQLATRLDTITANVEADGVAADEILNHIIDRTDRARRNATRDLTQLQKTYSDLQRRHQADE